MRSVGSGGAPMPGAAPGQYTTRDRPESRSIDGITNTRSGALAREEPSMEGDRQRAVPQQRVVERAEREVDAESPYLARPQLQQQRPTHEVGQRIGRAVRVPLDLRSGVVALEA